MAAMTELDICPICDGTGLIIDDEGDPGVWVIRTTKQGEKGDEPCSYCGSSGYVTPFARTAYYLRMSDNPWWIPREEIQNLKRDLVSANEVKK